MAGSKSRASVLSGRIAIDGITVEQFDQLVTLLAQWIRSEEVVVRFILPSSVRLEFDEDNISRQLKNSQLPSGCMAQLRFEISFMLQGILGGHRKAVASFIADNSTVSEVKGEPKHSKEQIRGEVETRIRCVEEKIVTSDLRRQFAIKNSAKTNTYLGASWDVVEKRSDSIRSTPTDLAHATVQITAQTPQPTERGEIVFMPYMFSERTGKFENFVLTMTLEDLRDLAKELGNAAEALRQTMERGKRP